MMKKLSLLVLMLGLITLAGCHQYKHSHGEKHGHGEHCPPGQAKKGKC